MCKLHKCVPNEKKMSYMFTFLTFVKNVNSYILVSSKWTSYFLQRYHLGWYLILQCLSLSGQYFSWASAMIKIDGVDWGAWSCIHWGTGNCIPSLWINLTTARSDRLACGWASVCLPHLKLGVDVSLLLPCPSSDPLSDCQGLWPWWTISMTIPWSESTTGVSSTTSESLSISSVISAWWISGLNPVLEHIQG